MGKAENHVEQYLRDRISDLDGICFKFSSGVNGVPDRIVLINERTVFVELKAKNGRLSSLQKVQIDRTRARGADVRVMHTRELVDEFIAGVRASLVS
ncbi:VRR-NUC domain-containing protein [Nesterenkonia sphaerica]|uniref:VRR-NUC domain-containing protein n=1 Tax=Nesterenkonia sphaerica TaxID=1804988 RepID=A0A5R9A5W1_9MICC|nr:VRR-NUC domain-containing protein [Nesterenkonia sphaerica]TLP73307.1 VRR-NUC domain-containing protein [Nesterenkonia sphaerica]